jgi:predicted DNA-binding protein
MKEDVQEIDTSRGEHRIEDLEDFNMASAIMARVRAGTEPVYPLEEIERELGLAGQGDEEDAR